MSSTAGDEGQGGQLGAKEVRTRGLPLAAIFSHYFAVLVTFLDISLWTMVCAPG